MQQKFESTRQSFHSRSGESAVLYSLPALAKKYPNVSRLPVSLRIVLESVLCNCDGRRVTAAHVAQLANWQAEAPKPQSGRRRLATPAATNPTSTSASDSGSGTAATTSPGRTASAYNAPL